jgi:hypothetical protein
LPTPPATDTPPTKAAAMASNSNRVPAVVVADRNQENHTGHRYFPRRRVVTSKITAAASTAALTMY